MVKVRLTKLFDFDAAHSLPNHKGKCAGIHGHTYKLEITVEGVLKDMPGSSDDGMVVDYFDIKTVVEKNILSKVDHKNLDEVFNFRTTVENIALHILRELQEIGQENDMRFVKVKLWESPTSYCEVGDF